MLDDLDVEIIDLGDLPEAFFFPLGNKTKVKILKEHLQKFKGERVDFLEEKERLKFILVREEKRERLKLFFSFGNVPDHLDMERIAREGEKDEEILISGDFLLRDSYELEKSSFLVLDEELKKHSDDLFRFFEKVLWEWLQEEVLNNKS